MTSWNLTELTHDSFWIGRALPEALVASVMVDFQGWLVCFFPVQETRGLIAFSAKKELKRKFEIRRR